VSTHSLSLRLNHRVAESPWFLDELQAARAAHTGLWILCGDFNLIYKVEDKNNSRLNYPLMGAFCSFLDELELAELHLQGRLDAWSNEQAHPMLSRIDHVFECSRWLELYPHQLIDAF
jgi:endonuclease/exonuclease/phosphatase family metal-dependent hydrolase